MNRLGWFIFIIISVAVVYKVFIRPSQTFKNIAPQQSSCSLDATLSVDYQKKIIKSIQELYQKNKNSYEVIEKISQAYPELVDMQAEICGADTVCIYAQTSNPIFLHNDRSVVFNTGLHSNKENIDADILDKLPKIYSKRCDDYVSMVDFIQKISKEIVRDYTVVWLDKDQIIFKSKDCNMLCLASVSLIPTAQIFQDCKTLYEHDLKKGSKKKNNKTMVEYDIRFKNQIIIKSGGKYGSCVSFDYYSN